MENNNNNNISVARIVSTGTTPESNHFIGLPDVVQDNPNASALLSMIQAFDWNAALARIQQFPNECQDVSFRGRTPLHVACAAHNVPEEIIRSLIKAYPQACVHGGTTGMNPLHIVCSSDHASANIVRILLLTAKEVQVQLAEQMCSMADADLDTPLHAACRCGAPLDVLKMLMLIYPDAVHQRDYEGLTPLLRLWVREYVLLGDEKINGVKGPADLVGELGEAWQKTMLLLYCSYMGSLQPLVKRGDTTPTTTTSTTTTTTTATTTSTTTSTTDASTEKTFRPLHAVATIDCPRRVVKIATIVHRDQLLVRDENGMYVILSCGACCKDLLLLSSSGILKSFFFLFIDRTPLLLASQAPIYKFQDIADDGSDLEDKLESHLYEDDDNEDDEEMADASEDTNKTLPSVIDQFVQAEPSAVRLKDPNGKSPLEYAMETGKKRNQGIKALIEVEGLDRDMERALKITTDH